MATVMLTVVKKQQKWVWVFTEFEVEPYLHVYRATL